MLIQTPDVGRRLQQLYRLTRLPSTTIAPEVLPVVLVDDVIPKTSPDDRACWGYGVVATPITNFPAVGLRLPLDARYRLVVERITVSSADSPWNIRLAAVFGANPPTIQPPELKNFRQVNLAGKPQTEVVTQDTVAHVSSTIVFGTGITGTPAQFQTLSLEGVYLDPLSMGGAFNSIWVTGDTGQALSVAWTWREVNVPG